LAALVGLWWWHPHRSGLSLHDLPFWALQLRHPTKVSAAGSQPNAEAVADWLIVNYDFPARAVNCRSEVDLV